MNSISWSPHEYGLILACVSADGSVSVHEHQRKTFSFTYASIIEPKYSPLADDTWRTNIFQDGPHGCNAISWAPSTSLGSQVDGKIVKRLAIPSCDTSIKIWKYDFNFFPPLSLLYIDQYFVW